jgi:Holliday junction resolvase-like predicted endonuclease
MEINSRNVGRIAERIAMNELEARGFHIIDLAYVSKTSANVDFIASKEGNSFNVQVKGTTNPPGARWAVQYGYCDEDIVERRRDFYNGKSEFALKADVVVLLAVKSPSDYRAVVMPVQKAEEAAQMNMDGYYRLPKLGGGKRTPNKVWTDLEPAAKPRKLNPSKDTERALLNNYIDAWNSLGGLHNLAHS